jgi:hypothetical protein
VDHGLALHGRTFVYHNGPIPAAKAKARLRNFLFGREFARSHVITSKQKAETHRLGAEMSEDALSYNVFVALLQAGKLRTATQWLTGRSFDGEPHLYMWGSLADLTGLAAAYFRPLLELRSSLEPDIKKFWTEPDVMLVVPGRFVVCIEAKFGSGNPLAGLSSARTGEKPTDIAALKQKYLRVPPPWPGQSKDVVPELIKHPLHSQLFRNVVFASRMASLEGQGAEWHVANLVSTTQWSSKSGMNHVDYTDPTAAVRSYLPAERQGHFTWRTWENLYTALVRDDSALADLASYMRGKSAHFRRAFSLS